MSENDFAEIQVSPELWWRLKKRSNEDGITVEALLQKMVSAAEEGSSQKRGACEL